MRYNVINLNRWRWVKTLPSRAEALAYATLLESLTGDLHGVERQ